MSSKIESSFDFDSFLGNCLLLLKLQLNVKSLASINLSERNLVNDSITHVSFMWKQYLRVPLQVQSISMQAKDNWPFQLNIYLYNI